MRFDGAVYTACENGEVLAAAQDGTDMVTFRFAHDGAQIGEAFREPLAGPQFN
jgi:hypothetical protein